MLVPVVPRGRAVGAVEFDAGRIAEPNESDWREALGTQIGSFCARAEERNRLRAKEERYESRVELAAIGMSHADPNGRFVHVNRARCNMLGYCSEELARVERPADR